MQSTDSQKNQSQTTSKAVLGAVIGGVILLALFIFAIFQAAHEESVLGWIVAGIILAWLGVALYLLSFITKQIKANQASYEAAMRAHRAEEDAMLDEKLAHSFQIVLVQTKVISQERANPSQDSEGMIDRAIDTINTTAQNGMGMIKEATGK